MPGSWHAESVTTLPGARYADATAPPGGPEHAAGFVDALSLGGTGSDGVRWDGTGPLGGSEPSSAAGTADPLAPSRDDTLTMPTAGDWFRYLDATAPSSPADGSSRPAGVRSTPAANPGGGLRVSVSGVHGVAAATPGRRAPTRPAPVHRQPAVSGTPYRYGNSAPVSSPGWLPGSGPGPAHQGGPVGRRSRPVVGQPPEWARPRPRARRGRDFWGAILFIGWLIFVLVGSCVQQSEDGGGGGGGGLAPTRTVQEAPEVPAS